MISEESPSPSGLRSADGRGIAGIAVTGRLGLVFAWTVCEYVTAVFL